MGSKKIYIVAKVFDKPGCLAYICKTPNEARCLPGTLEALRADGVQIVILDDGKISDVGTHEELLGRSEIYRQIYESQKEGVEL